MKPYYDDGRGIVIYHGDAREVLPSIGEIGMVITDPPYGMDYRSSRRTEWQRKGKIQGDTEFPSWLFDLKPEIAMMMCCRWSNLRDIPQPKSFIVWDKCRHSMGDLDHEFGRQWEAIAFYAGPKHEFTKRPTDIIRVPCIPPSGLVHPAEKPLELFTPLIQAHPNCLIVDPFMGTGPVLQAAKELGRRAIGVELEERWCDVAARRLTQEVLAL